MLEKDWEIFGIIRICKHLEIFGSICKWEKSKWSDILRLTEWHINDEENSKNEITEHRAPQGSVWWWCQEWSSIYLTPSSFVRTSISAFLTYNMPGKEWRQKVIRHDHISSDVHLAFRTRNYVYHLIDKKYSQWQLILQFHRLHFTDRK